MLVNIYGMVNRYRNLIVPLERTTLTLDTRGTLHLQSKFDGIYVFGDSLCDVGNAFDATTKATGEGSPPSPPYFEGRFSNGWVWVEYLALLLGLTSHRSTNFAVGGATSGSMNTFIPDNPLNLPGLQQQINSFVASLKETSQVANSQALYIVWAGANDYLGGGVTNPAMPIENLLHAVTSLATVGAQNCLVINLPDLGVLPATRKDSQQSLLLTELTKAHNISLAESLNALQSSLGSSVNIILFDLNSVFNQILSNPTTFGFTNVTDAELDRIVQSQPGTEKFFFWDGIHPTTASHIILAKSVFSLLFPTSVTEPYTENCTQA
ncbi:SGNH/GDSL hydrolase family protein [Scytonema sp. NUACC21]